MPTLDRVLRRAPAGTRILAAAVLVAAVGLAGVGQAGATGSDKNGDDKKSDNHRNDGRSYQKSDKSKSKTDDHEGSDAPKGNNGHIQIDKFVMAGGNRNRPKAECGFSVSFFGYDAGTQHATITMTPKSPTKGGTSFAVSTEWTVATRTSGNQFDKNVPISPEQVAAAFKGVAPHKQGFHAKVDVHVTGSQGSDAKHKVLWIKPCATAASTTTSTMAPTTTTAAPTTTTTAAAEGAVHAQPATVAGGEKSSTGAASSASATTSPTGSVQVAGSGASASGSQIAPATPAVAINAAATTTG